MENKQCYYCGYFGGMYLVHSKYHCPSCKCFCLLEDNDAEQDVYDDDLIEARTHPAIFVTDLLLQRA